MKITAIHLCILKRRTSTTYTMSLTHETDNRCCTHTAQHHSIGVLHRQIGRQAVDAVLVNTICTCLQLQPANSLHCIIPLKSSQ